jgi:hypothetical protein
MSIHAGTVSLLQRVKETPKRPRRTPRLRVYEVMDIDRIECHDTSIQGAEDG